MIHTYTAPFKAYNTLLAFCLYIGRAMGAQFKQRLRASRTPSVQLPHRGFGPCPPSAKLSYSQQNCTLPIIKYYLISIVTSFCCECNHVVFSLSCGFYKPKHNMQDHAIKLTHLFSQATAFINVRLPREAATTGSPLVIRYCTETVNYSRVKFIVHYFLGGSLSESNHSLLNSAGTAARTSRVRARRVLEVVMSVESLRVGKTSFLQFFTFIHLHSLKIMDDAKTYTQCRKICGIQHRHML